MTWFVNARRVNENYLSVFHCYDALNFMARRLRFVGNSRDLFADKTIQQCGLSGIWTADKACIAAAKIIVRH